jgi:hypothetical protein
VQSSPPDFYAVPNPYDRRALDERPNEAEVTATLVNSALYEGRPNGRPANGIGLAAISFEVNRKVHSTFCVNRHR